MPETVRRGFVPEDEKEFHGDQLLILREAQRDTAFLLNRGYGIGQTITFVGDRFQLSARQRMALKRATCGQKELESRMGRELTGGLAGRALTIDGFNLIITLEAALSGSTVLRCMDGTLRDLCGLRGSYRLIDKTDAALSLIASALKELKIVKALFVLDRPVSNSGRLRQQILETLAGCPFETEVTLTEHADAALTNSACVATSDSIVLNNCADWVSLADMIVKESLPDFKPVELSFG